LIVFLLALVACRARRVVCGVVLVDEDVGWISVKLLLGLRR